MFSGLPVPGEVVGRVVGEMVGVGITITGPGGRVDCCAADVNPNPIPIGDAPVGSLQLIADGTAELDALLDGTIGSSTTLALSLFITVVG